MWLLHTCSGAQLQGTWRISCGSYFNPSDEEQCPNSSFNPSARSSRRILYTQVANQHPPPTNKLFDRLTSDNVLTSVCSAAAEYMPTFQHTVYLVDSHFISMRTLNAEKCLSLSETKTRRWNCQSDWTGDASEENRIMSQSRADLDWNAKARWG